MKKLAISISVLLLLFVFPIRVNAQQEITLDERTTPYLSRASISLEKANYLISYLED